MSNPADRHTNKQTNQHHQKHNLMAEVNIKMCKCFFQDNQNLKFIIVIWASKTPILMAGDDISLHTSCFIHTPEQHDIFSVISSDTPTEQHHLVHWLLHICPMSSPVNP